MTKQELVRKYFSKEEIDTFLYAPKCILCYRTYDPDESSSTLYEHLKTCHPNLKEFK